MKLARKVGTFALIATMTLPMAACNWPENTSPQNPSEVEFEDCDAEDWKNYEAECFRKSPKPIKPSPKKPAPKPTKRK